MIYCSVHTSFWYDLTSWVSGTSPRRRFWWAVLCVLYSAGGRFGIRIYPSLLDGFAKAISPTESVDDSSSSLQFSFNMFTTRIVFRLGSCNTCVFRSFSFPTWKPFIIKRSWVGKRFQAQRRKPLRVASRTKHSNRTASIKFGTAVIRF